MDIRLCEKRDEDIWITMNREFMFFLIREESSWSGTEKTSDSIFRNTFNEAMQSSSYITLLIFEEDGIPIGYANLMSTFSVWSHGKLLILDDIFFREEYRRKGHGREAMKYIEDYAKENGFKRLHFQSTPTNPDAKPFYQALGFTPAIANFYGKNIT